MSTSSVVPVTGRRPGPWRRFKGRVARCWWGIVPETRARLTISIAGLLAATAAGGALGWTLLSGEGEWVDVAFGAAVVFLLSLLVWPGLMLGVWLLHRLTDVFGRIGLGALLALGFVLTYVGVSPRMAMISAAVVSVVTALVSGALGASTGGGMRRAGALKKAWLLLCFLGGLGGGGWVAWWTVCETGTDDHVVVVATIDLASLPAPLTADDPGARGSFEVERFAYGWGKDRHREEFGEGVRYRTETVNAKPFFKWSKGWKGVMRTRFWGIEHAGEIPLNAQVWMPKGEGPFPIVLCVHGNHHMADWSDPGYAYLGELIASRGMIFCSVDENFLNGSRVAGGFRGENDARGWVLLQHLGQWRRWNADENHPLRGRADLDRVGLIGHSRGGEAGGHAALFNRLKRWPDDASVKFEFGFGIRGIVAIAPSDAQYKPADRPGVPKDVNLLCLHGGHDADVSSFVGDRLFRRLELSPDSGCFKASAWIYRANHGQFNTTWGDSDRSLPGALLLNRKALMSGEDQRRCARTYIGAFLATVLQDRTEWRPMFRDARVARDWLPDTPIITRYEDATFHEIAGFEEDFDVTTATVAGSVVETNRLVVWREGDIPHRSSSKRLDTGVWIGWNPDEEDPAPAEDAPPPSYTIRLPDPLPDDLKPSANGRLVLHVCASKDKPKPKDYSNEEDEKDENDESEKAKDTDRNADIDFTVEVTDAAGAVARVPVSRFARIYPPLLSRMTRLALTEERYKNFEPVLQTVEIPFSALREATPTLDVAALSTIRFVLDLTPKAVIILDRVGLTRD
ncbi:MAG: hypothetical protein CMJ83_15755 [Planctomycetes bacterium]|nr:hypothetical protein [Planctomycetota bacterium]